MRNNHLGVGLGAEGTRLEERLLVPDALAIYVKPGLDVVDSVDDEIERFPELIIEKIFCLGGNISLVSRHLELRVHGLGLSTGSRRLRAADIGLSEEELAVQVGDLDVVVVSDSDGTVWSAAETHEGHGLGVLTSEGTSSDHEGLDVSEHLLGLTAVDLDLIIVAAAHGLS